MYHVSELPNSLESLLFSIPVEIKEAEKKGRVQGVENNSNGKIISVILRIFKWCSLLAITMSAVVTMNSPVLVLLPILECV
jgi:hypothetical protein